MNRKIVIAVNTAWNIANFRAGLVRSLIAAGWEVVAMAPADEHVTRVLALGCRFVNIPIQADGTNPWRDLLLYRRFKGLLARERPAAFLAYTIKPNIYGSLAAQSLGIPVVNNIAGLGTAFIRHTWLTHLARLLYRIALRRSCRVLFQNKDDHRYFVDTGLVAATQSVRVPGSGVDLTAFASTPLPHQHGCDRPIRFLFVGRMLADKGVREFVQAARIVVSSGAAAEFQLLGFAGAANRSAIGLDELEEWQNQGLVQYLGATDDVRPFIADAHCVVLPSYREGVPRTLLEAAAMARPLIATDVVGCREAVDEGVNGFLVRVRDAVDLADACQRFMELDAPARARMGQLSRKKVESEFDEKIVTQTYLDLLQTLPTRA